MFKIPLAARTFLKAASTKLSGMTLLMMTQSGNNKQCELVSAGKTSHEHNKKTLIA